MAAIPKTRTVLESGDRLTREDFHRRYCRRPDIRKAELVRGVVYVASPTRTDMHADPVGLVAFWLNAYRMKVPGLRVAVDGTVFLAPDSELQPDVFLYWQPARGSGARLNAEGYIEGAPELVVEVAASSASYDLHDKVEAYRLAGVPELHRLDRARRANPLVSLTGRCIRGREPGCNRRDRERAFSRFAAERRRDAGR
jgi:Uma2 family endonuclease